MNGKEELIMDAAEKTFATHGFKETSVREIAGVAGVSSAMLNYYFFSKEKLLESVLERRLNRFTGRHDLHLLQHMHSRDRLLRVINLNVKMIGANTPFIRFILREHFISTSPESAAIISRYMAQQIQIIKTVLAEGVEKGDFKPMDIELTGMAISGAYVNCVINPNFISGAISTANLYRRLITFFRGYIESLTAKCGIDG